MIRNDLTITTLKASEDITSAYNVVQISNSVGSSFKKACADSYENCFSTIGICCSFVNKGEEALIKQTGVCRVRYEKSPKIPDDLGKNVYLSEEPGQVTLSNPKKYSIVVGKVISSTEVILDIDTANLRQTFFTLLVNNNFLKSKGTTGKFLITTLDEYQYLNYVALKGISPFGENKKNVWFSIGDKNNAYKYSDKFYSTGISWSNAIFRNFCDSSTSLGSDVYLHYQSDKPINSYLSGSLLIEVSIKNI